MSRDDKFDPHSLNATLARIIAGQEEANRKSDAILAQVTKTNGRVTKLETWREVMTAKISIIAATISAVVSAVAWAAKYLAS